jgi:hypothetical protein
LSHLIARRSPAVTNTQSTFDLKSDLGNRQRMILDVEQ